MSFPRTSTMTSISKESLNEVELESQPRRTTTAPSQCTTHLCNQFTHSQTRTSYLTLRILSITFALLQITLVAIAASGAISSMTPPAPSEDNPDADPKRRLRRWLDPSLSPAISSFFWCAFDVLGVVKWKRRAHHLARAIYDGVLAAGFSVGAGVFLHKAWGVLNGEVEGTTVAERGVGSGLVCCMFVMVVLHSLVSFGGIRDTIETRRAIRVARQAGQS